MTTSDTADLQSRLQRTVEAVGASGLDGLLVSPGPDLRYLTGYDAIPLERLTCLVVPASGPVRIVVPALEVAAAMASPIADLGVEVVSGRRRRTRMC